MRGTRTFVTPSCSVYLAVRDEYGGRRRGAKLCGREVRRIRERHTYEEGKNR